MAEPTEAEIADVSKACSRLWSLDVNRARLGTDVVLDLQGAVRVSGGKDNASKKLFRFINPALLEKPTYKTFKALLDNYERKCGVPERVTKEELVEQSQFIQALLETDVIRYVHHYLVLKGKAPKSVGEFGKQLETLWFQLHGRQASGDTSSFEHVFVGEVRDGKVIGFHNWIAFHLEEEKNAIDYYGYVPPRDRSKQTTDHDHVISIQFGWGEEVKPVSTSFIGVSPEFEVALYTLLFYAGGTDNMVVLDKYHVNIKVFHSQGSIGSCFPILD